MTAVALGLAISRDQVLTSNVEYHWADRARRVRSLRGMALVMARFHNHPTLPPSECVVTVTWPDNRKRDAHNLGPTFKACFDGFVDGRLLVDDNDTQLTSVTVKASPVRKKTPGVACYLEFAFTPREGS